MIILSGKILERLRESNYDVVKLEVRFPSKTLDTVIDLAGVASQFPDGSKRASAMRKLREIDPNFEIANINGEQYLHGWSSNDGTDIYFEIPKIKPFEEYNRKYS